MRLIDILATASANTFRSKLRTALTIIAIFIGAFTLTLTNGLGSGISSYIDKQVNNLGAKDVLLIRAANSAGSSSSSDAPKKYDPNKKVAAIGGFGESVTVLTDNDVTKIKKTAGIKSVQPSRNVSPDYIKGVSADKYQVAVSQFISGSNLDLAAGRAVDNNATANEAIIPVTYVSSLGYANSQAAIGKLATIGITDGFGQQHSVTATIVGVQQRTLAGGGNMITNPALLNSLYTEQEIGLPKAATNSYQLVSAKFDSHYSDSQITALKATLKQDGYNAQTVEDQIGTFKQVISGIIAVLDAFAVIALLAASFGIINTLLMSVQERTKEIGLMKAMGMSGGRIFLLFSTEAVILGFWGSFIGVVVAEVVGRIADHIVSTGFLKDLVGLQLLAFPLQSVVTIIVLVMVIAFVAGTLPAYRAARQNPIDSLRYE